MSTDEEYALQLTHSRLHRLADATEVKVSIAAGVLSDTVSRWRRKLPDFFASSEGMHTVTPSTTVTGGLATGDTRDNVTEETEFTLKGMLAPDSFVVVEPRWYSVNVDVDVDEILIAELPNIQRFFAKGGTISLVGGSSAAGDPPNKSVVITEIMWGLNHSRTIDYQADYQWIELYNTDNVNSDAKTATGDPATVDLSEYKLVFTPGTDLPKPENLADQVSNVELGGWDVDVGQSGSLGKATETFSPTRMISMYRNITYDNVTKVRNKDDAVDNRKKQLAAIPTGNVEGSWEASKVSDTYATNQQGSPGAKHFVGRAGFDATSVGRNAVVITEVGNNSNDAYDWVELVAIADTNLENYELQHIDKDKKITVLAQFVKKVLKAGEILVVLQSNPRDNPEHPVAAGKEWKLADADRDNTGIVSLYHVDSKLIIPDKGKALFVLRSAKDKKNHENIVDLAGNSFVTDNTSAYRTRLWPLRAAAAGGSNVIDGDKIEDFNSGRVYKRNNRDSGIGDKHWSVPGYTGVGYKRSAAKNGQNGGTPGFDNGAVTDKSSTLTDASVTISELMYDRGSKGNLPQWIELYNGSDTQAVNLNEWKLKIENADDVDVRTPRSYYC